MSALLNSQGAVVTDAYILLADEAAMPDTGGVIVSLTRWQAEVAVLTARSAPVAVKLANTADVLTLSADVLARPMLVLDFPAFGDGRAYSQARRLRDRCGFTGKLRATGAATVIDQLLMMRRSGFDEMQLRSDQSISLAVKTLLRSTKAGYQPDAIESVVVSSLRG